MENSQMDMMQDAMQGAPMENTPQDNTADAGRGTDSVMAHLSLGEVVIPRAFLDDPNVMQALQQIFEAGGADMNQYTVGHEANSINPETGYPEFGFGKFLRKAFSIAAPIALSYFAPGIGTALGSTLSASTLGAIGGGIGGAAGGALSGGGVKGALTGAALGAGGGYLSNGGASELLGGTQLGNTLGLSNPEGGSVIGNAIGSSGVGGSASTGQGLFGSLLSGDTFGTTAGSVLPNGIGPTQGTGVLGAAGRVSSSIGSNLGGLTSGAGGGSSFGGISTLGSVLGGFQQDSALKKQKQQLLAAQGQQLGNLENLNPKDVQNDPGYQFNLEQGQQGLNRALGAQGGLFSGNALKAASEYNQNFANNYYNQAYQRQANKVGAQNDIYGNTGNINANATMASSNNINQTLANALGANVGNYNGGQMSNADLLALMKQRGLA
ncbi:MAG: hypothetical protein KA770_00240 [Shewanella sp.]|nr:hypothetical protein [Shewanella sp.]